MSFLKKIKTQVNDWNQRPVTSDSLSFISDFLSNDIIWLLQRAVLSGEYCDMKGFNSKHALDDIEIEITNFKSKITAQAVDTSCTTILIGLADIFTSKYLKKFEKLSLDVKKRLECLYSGQDGLISELDPLYYSYLYSFFLDEFDNFSSQQGVSKKSFFNQSVFQLNIQLAYLDEHLECKDPISSTLKRVEDFLNSLPQNKFVVDVIQKLKYKAAFLAFKIYYRKEHVNHEYSSNQQVVIAPTSPFHIFYSKIIKHYRGPFEAHALVKDIKSIGSDSFQVEPLHHINRYYLKEYKDSFPDKIKLFKPILEKIAEYQKIAQDFLLYDKVALTSLDKLISNSILKLDLGSEASNNYPNIISHFQNYILGKTLKDEPEFIEKLELRLTDINNEELYPDYFCYITFLRFLDKMIEFLIQQNEILITPDILKTDHELVKKKLVNIVKYIDRLYQKNLKKLRYSLDKMLSHNAKPLYMAVDECMIPCEYNDGVSIVNGNMFLHSSYILPNNFALIKERIGFWQSFLGPQLNLLKDSIAITFNQHLIKTNLDNSEKKLKENEFKLVQITAMFVSIAAFVLSSVKIFDDKTPLESFGIILGLAASLFLFNLFFYLIIVIQYQSEKQGWKFFWKAFKYLMIPIIFIFVGYWMMYSEKGNRSKSIKNANEKIDSIMKNIESIKKKYPF